MGCSGCPGNEKSARYDSRGNVIGIPESAEVGTPPPPQPPNGNPGDEVREMRYQEYTVERDAFREASRKAGDEKVTEFSEDYKRIQIDELISVYNHEEVHFKLTPSQALMALWEFSSHPVYAKVFSEFEGLRERVVEEYEKIKAKRIEIKWRA